MAAWFVSITFDNDSRNRNLNIHYFGIFFLDNCINVDLPWIVFKKWYDSNFANRRELYLFSLYLISTLPYVVIM